VWRMEAKSTEGKQTSGIFRSRSGVRRDWGEERGMSIGIGLRSRVLREGCVYSNSSICDKGVRTVIQTFRKREEGAPYREKKEGQL